MSLVILVLGILFVGTGFVVLIHRLHERSVQDAWAVIREAHGDTVHTVASFGRLTLPIVSPIAGGIVLMAVAVLGLTRI